MRYIHLSPGPPLSLQGLSGDCRLELGGSLPFGDEMMLFTFLGLESWVRVGARVMCMGALYTGTHT